MSKRIIRDIIDAIFGMLSLIFKTPLYDREMQQALREGIRELGAELGQLATMHEMIEIARKVSSKMPNSDRALTIIDAQWDGLRTKDDRIWWR